MNIIQTGRKFDVEYSKNKGEPGETGKSETKQDPIGPSQVQNPSQGPISCL